MTTVTISPKFQMVIPADIRQAMHLVPGQQLCVFRYDDRIEYIPVKSMKKMRGFLKGINTQVLRENDRV